MAFADQVQESRSSAAELVCCVMQRVLKALIRVWEELAVDRYQRLILQFSYFNDSG